MLPCLGAASLERAEIYFLDGARGMVETGDLVVPRYRGEPFFDKPALTYWLMAASFRLFGPTPAAGRLVAALAAIAVIAATVALGRARLSRPAAWAGGLALATTHAFVSFGRLAMSDMLLTLFSTTAVALTSVAVAPRRALWRAAAVGAVLGGGFMVKGPVAVLFPVLGIAALGWTRGVRTLPPLRVLAVTALGFAAVGLPWFAAVYHRLGAGPLEYFFLRENLERFAGATYDSGQPFWYYVPGYLVMGLPWSVFLPLAAWRAVRPSGSAAVRGLLLWAALMAVPLSLSRGKIDYYILPLLPPLSLALGHFLTGEDWQPRETRVVRGLLALLAVVVLVFAAAPGWLPPAWRPPLAIAGGLAVGFVGLAVLLARAAARATPARTVRAVAIASAAAHLAAVVFLVPAFTRAQPNARILDDVSRERRYRSDAGFAFCSDPTRVARDVLFNERLSSVDSCSELWAAAGGAHPFLLLVSADERASLGQIPFVREVGDYEYLAPTALSAVSAWSRPAPSRIFLIANFETDEPVAMERWRRERRRDLKLLEGAAAP